MKCFDCPEKYKCPIYENSPNYDSRMAKVLKCPQKEQKEEKDGDPDANIAY